MVPDTGSGTEFFELIRFTVSIRCDHFAFSVPVWHRFGTGKYRFLSLNTGPYRYRTVPYQVFSISVSVGTEFISKWKLLVGISTSNGRKCKRRGTMR
ncbi:hypothetical protein HanRHA438_Chr11g0529361 [Helianthus annuus]|nr:hypothetical protein HanRHA438_Chr11g0529361 [Helianthus annuus]